jgi:hypothetical protein
MPPNQLPRHDDPTEIEPRPHPVGDVDRPNATHLKQAITSGDTGDKVAMFDPGFANLGTDNEAAGTPTTPEMVKLAIETERMADPPHGDPGRRAAIGTGWKILAAVALLVGLAVVALLLG